MSLRTRIQHLTRQILNQCVLNGCTVDADPTVALGVASKQYVDGRGSVDATPNTFVLRDGNGRAKIAAPAVAADIARRDTVVGLYGSRGLVAVNNASTPTTKLDISADAVVLRDSANNPVVVHNPGTLINDVSVTGPAANGRDQSGAFSANSWIHFYWIWNGSALATISSASAPPTGPTLPSGYSYWAYATTLRFNASSQLVRMILRGKWAHYATAVSVLANGASTTEAAVSLSAVVPPNALQVELQLHAGANGSNDWPIRFRVVSGANYFSWVGAQYGAVDNPSGLSLTIPNVNRNFYYLWNSAPGSVGLNVSVTGFAVPNGGE